MADQTPTPPDQPVDVTHAVAVAAGTVAGAVILAPVVVALAPLVGLGAVATAIGASGAGVGGIIGGWFAHKAATSGVK